MKQFLIGITPDVRMSNGQPIFGTEVLELLKQPGIAWEYMQDGSQITLEHAQRYDAICAMTTRLGPDSLPPGPHRLKLIARFGVGYDSIDIPTATRLGIVVAFTPGMLDGAVADYTWALLFALARRVHEGHVVMRDNRWSVAWGHDVSNKTLGIIGCGRIGQAVAKRASGFNMKILGHDIAPNPHAEALGVKFVSLDELLAQSDFVSLNCALTPQNRGLIGEAQFNIAKPNLRVINAARGGIVDEAALYEALKSGRIAGAGLDVYAKEPCTDSPLFALDNVVATPHLGASTEEAQEKAGVAVAESVVAAFAGNVVPGAVNAGTIN